MPVEVGNIDRQLKVLWEQGGESATRASLMNLAIYCEGEQAVAENTRLIADITQDHACRAILIAAQPEAPETRVEAWINAHCHVSRAGAKQVCCEQITFLLEGDVHHLIPNIVFAHLDSDLPLYLWWQGEFPASIDDQLLNWVDRLIYDSQNWKNARQQLAIVRAAAERMKSRLTLCDLNWARFLPIREAFAKIFDDPVALEHIWKIRSVSVTHGPANRSTAVLLVAWLMAQLSWKLVGKEKDVFRLEGRSGEITARLKRGSLTRIAECVIETDEAAWSVSKEAGSEFMCIRIRLPGAPEQEHLFPAPTEGALALLSDELSRGSRHAVYNRVLDALQQLL